MIEGDRNMWPFSKFQNLLCMQQIMAKLPIIEREGRLVFGMNSLTPSALSRHNLETRATA